ncbi:MAG: metal-binding protein [Chloroflexaceae bacterium]|nr:metal-binding protein [Chloroflexaceae bacterium]
MNQPTGGRLVWNHSTHIPGLIGLLEKLIARAPVETVTPGALSRARGHCPRLTLRVSVPIRGGYKLIARQGKTVQEVFIVTDLSQEALEAAIAEVL